MATAQKLTDHFLTCTICHDVFTDPSTLNCGHSFCGECLVSFTKTQSDAIESKSILCPFCRRLTRVPDPSRPVEEWAGQMRASLLLKGLIDTVGPGSKDTTNCNLCQDEGETTLAVSWCSVCDVSLCTNCLKAHRRNPASRHHDVSDVTDEVKVTRKREVHCHIHKGESVKFFCRDCQKTLCQTCCILDHRKCESVVTLESMMPEMKSILKTRKETLIERYRDVEKQLDSFKSRCNELDETKSSIQAQIRCTTQKVIEAAKKKEKELLDELNEVIDKQMTQLRADIKTGDMTRDICKQQSELIDQALNSESEMDMYELFQSSESEAAESYGNQEKRGAMIKIEFSQDSWELDRILNELSFGKIKVFGVDLDTLVKSVLSHTITVRTREDENDPNILGLISMKGRGIDTLIVSDLGNECIKSFFKRNNQQHHSRLSMQSEPVSIAKIEDNEIAVSLPKSNQIAIVSVTPDLTLDSTITTQNAYFGITSLTTETLAAGSVECVDILNKNGDVLRTLNPVQNGMPLIKIPFSLSTTGKGNILISDHGTARIICLAPNGDVEFTYPPSEDSYQNDTEESASADTYDNDLNDTIDSASTDADDSDLNGFGGIVGTAAGAILVVNHDGNSVMLLRESGEFVRDILTSDAGISGPLCIEWDESERIYVTGVDERNLVKVFQFE